MIKIKNINGIPERELIEKEKSTITNSFSDGLNFYYYQNDEPNSLIDLQAKELISQNEGSAAFEAFKKASEEEKILIAQEIKKYL